MEPNYLKWIRLHLLRSLFKFSKIQIKWLWFIQSNEGSEDTYIGIAKKFLKCAYKSLITTDVHSYILMHLWLHLGMYALFEFNWNSSAESYVNSTLQIRKWNWREKTWVISSFPVDPVFSRWVNCLSISCFCQLIFRFFFRKKLKFTLSFDFCVMPKSARQIFLEIQRA